MTILSRLPLLILATALTACGGGSSSGSSGGGGGGPGDGTTEAIDGRAAKGVIDNADVIASAWHNGNWVEIATGQTDGEGRFSLDIDAGDTPVRVEVQSVVGTRMRCDAPSGCDGNAFGEFVDLPADRTLATIVPGDAISEDTALAITPLTHLAAAWVEHMPGDPNTAGVALAHARVAELFDLSEEFAYGTPVDITDEQEVDNASEMDLRHMILAAAFAELEATESLAPFSTAGDAAELFGLLGGQALNLSGEVTAEELEQMIIDLGGDPETLLADVDIDRLAVSGLDALAVAAETVGEEINREGALDAMIAGFETLTTRWDGRLLTALGGSTTYDSDDFDRALVALDDYDHYRGLAADGDAMVAPAERGLGWLHVDETAREDTEGLVTVLSEALGYAIDAAICIPKRVNGIDCEVEPGYAELTNIDSSLFNHNTGDLEISGTRYGQTVDLDIHVIDIRDFLRDGELPIDIEGTVDNGTAETALDVTVLLDITDNDLSGFNELGNLEFADEEKLNPLLDELVADLHINVSLSGNGTITSTDTEIGSYAFNGLETFLEFNRRVLTQDENGPLMELALVSGERTNPAGEELYAIAGDAAFRLLLDDPASLELAYGFDRLNLPEMTFSASGELAGLTPVMEVLGDYFESSLDGDTDEEEIDIDWDGLLDDLDETLLSMTGDATLEINDPEQGFTAYQFTLSGDAVDVSLPNSQETAMSLRVSGLAGYIHAGDTLVSTVHLGNTEDGLLLSLVDGTQRSYPAANDGGAEQLETLFLFLESLLDGLFDTEEEET